MDNLFNILLNAALFVFCSFVIGCEGYGWEEYERKRKVLGSYIHHKYSLRNLNIITTL